MNAAVKKKLRFPDLVPFVVTCAGIVAALYYGQGLLRPLALAILITILLNASTEKLTQIEIGGFRLRRWMGLTISIGVVIAALLVIARILAGQVDDLNAVWPRYVARLEDIVAQLSSMLGTDIAGKVEGQIAKLDFSSWVSRIAGTTGSVLADFGMVSLYVAFMLSAQSSNFQKLIALFPLEKERSTISQLLASIVESTRKYILIKTATSVVTGLLSYAVMKFMGLDFAETWALLIFLLNYIPTIGSIIGVIFPSVLALVQFDTLVPFLVITGLLTGVQFTIGNVIEPVFMGRTLNLSSLVVILALAFWGSLWGIVGMFMSVPSTVMVMIFCARMPQLQWVAILLSEDGKIDGNSV
jgi:predicted PurR-regulated permease PerM